MINRYSYKDITWIDLEAPTREEVLKVATEYNIDSKIAEDLLTPSLKARVEVYPEFLCLTLHFPALKHSHKMGTDQEIDFIIGKKFMITTRYDAMDPIHEFSKIFEVNSILEKSSLGKHSGFVFFYMITHIYHALTHELNFIRDSLRDIEEKIFSGKEKEMVLALSKVSRNLLDFKRATDLHKEILQSLHTAGVDFFGQEFAPNMRLILSEYYKIENGAKNNLDFLRELRDTNNVLVSTKQNEIMKTLTGIALIAVPVSLISALFQIDAVSRPIIGKPNDFWIILSVMGATVLLMYAYFKHKKWL